MKWAFIQLNLITFLHRANAIIVIKLPGTPSNIKMIQAVEANPNNPDEYPWNNSPDVSINKNKEENVNNFFFVVFINTLKSNSWYNLSFYLPFSHICILLVDYQRT